MTPLRINCINLNDAFIFWLSTTIKHGCRLLLMETCTVVSLSKNQLSDKKADFFFLLKQSVNVIIVSQCSQTRSQWLLLKTKTNPPDLIYRRKKNMSESTTPMSIWLIQEGKQNKSCDFKALYGIRYLLLHAQKWNANQTSQRHCMCWFELISNFPKHLSSQSVTLATRKIPLGSSWNSPPLTKN